MGGVVVDLTVEDQDVAGRRIVPRLPSADRIDDRQAQVSGSELSINLNVLIIRAAMADGLHHRLKNITRVTVGVCESDYAAHCISDLACAHKYGYAEWQRYPGNPNTF